MSLRKHVNAASPDTLCSVLDAHATAAPEQPAYCFLRDGRTEQSRLTYVELDRRARAVAGSLHASGIHPGDRLLLLFPAGVDVLVALLGCLYAGVIAVPVPAPEASRMARTLPRLRAIADDARARGVVSCSSILAAIDTVPQAAAALGGFALDVAHVDGALALGWRPAAIGRDSLAYLQYTSGSTSTPKGVCITHAHLLEHLGALAAHCGRYSPESVTVNWMPYFHDYGLVEGMLLPLFNRTLCVLMSPYAFIKEPANWLRAISRYRATHSHAPNFAYSLCTRRIDRASLAELDLSRWQCAGNAAEPINAEVMASFARKFEPAGFRYQSFYPCYGLAEATLMVSYKASGQEPRAIGFDRAALEAGKVRVAASAASTRDTRTIVACGRPVEGARVVIVNPETCEQSPPDSVGEIWVSSPAVAGGYWQRIDATADTFRARLAGSDEGPFLRTGDLGFLYEGELFVCGRHKDLIILRGQNVSPQDIEWTVQDAHPALRPDCGAAFSIEVDGEERLVVAQEVQARLSRELDQEAVIAAIRSAVGEAHGVELHAIALVRSGGIAKTSSGKIQRRACRQLFLDGALNALAVWNRSSEAGRRDSEPAQARSQPNILDFILARVAAAAGQPVDTIDPGGPFARYGLDSLRTVALVNELECWLGRELPATLAFDYPNALALARHLESPTADGGEVRGAAAVQARQPIAIIGIGCRFPGGICGPDRFWQALQDGFDGVREVPAQRWDAARWYAPGAATPGRMNTRWGGFIDDVDAFDAGFFAMSPREARVADPQHRMLLEVTWEALEHAGVPAAELAGSRTGVFVGICSNDYQRLQAGSATLQESYAATGNALSIAANRISYTFDFHGPSWAVDTACSSSLVAVHQACRSLLAGESELALAGGVNLVLDPAATVAFSQANMMSPTGRCRTFSDDADGYVRAEGCAIVVLKRLDDAVRDGDRVIALIRGSAVNQDGRSNGLTAPSGPSQRAVVRAALTDAGVEARAVGYVEAHGTGTPLGDPIELNALAEVLREGRTAQARCWVGSVKTNIGHLEGAAGIAGLVKAALCVERGSIPGNLHFRGLNPHVRIEGTGLAVPTRTQSWPQGCEHRIAGVSSFGFGGTNAHVIVAAPPQARARTEAARRPAHLLCISARTRQALNALLSAYARRLRVLPDEDLADFCSSVNAGRSALAYRAMALGASRTNLADALERMEADSRSPALADAACGKVASRAPGIGFFFGGAGASTAAGAADLFQSSPVFARAAIRCAQRLDASTGDRMLRCVAAPPAFPCTTQEQALHAFVIQYAAWQLWHALGARPTQVCGAGPGLVAAACAAGVLTVEQALRLCSAESVEELQQVLSRMALTAPESGLVVIRGEEETPLAAALASALSDLGARREPIDPDVVWVALGPRPTDAVAATFGSQTVLAGFEAGTHPWAALLGALGRLYLCGFKPDWKGLDSPHPRRRIDLPTYPFERQRFWFTSESSGGKDRRAPGLQDVRPTAVTAESDAHSASGAFESVALLDWLRIELARLTPSLRRKLLEPFLEEERQDRVRAHDPGAALPSGTERPLSSADIRRLTDAEAEAVLRKRLESMNY